MLLVALVACGEGTAEDDAGTIGIDSGDTDAGKMDAGSAMVDAGRDAGRAVDAGRDAGRAADAGRTISTDRCARGGGDCTNDTDCVGGGGCGGEVCYPVTQEPPITTCDCFTPSATCGCVGGTCAWYE